MRLPALALAFLAGGCSLCFELLWIRLLEIETGGPLAAFTIVVCSFTLGLAGGSAAFGATADRTRSPLGMFGTLMLAAGGFGAVTACLAASGGIVRPVLLWLHLEPGQAMFSVVQVVTSGALTLVAAVTMGGTLPLLWKLSRDSVSGNEIGLGLLAASSSTGAAAGCLICGFVLLPRLGLWRSILTTALACLATGALALAGARRSGSHPARGHAARALSEINAGPMWRPGTAALLVIVGAAMTALEVAWARLASLAFGSSAQAAAIVLAAVIAGLASGNFIGGVALTRASSPGALLSGLACASALLIAAEDPLYGRMPLLASSRAFEAIAAGALQFLLVFLLVALPCLALGATLPVGCRAILSDPSVARTPARAVGLASAAISSGNVLGAPLAYFGVIPLVGSRGCLLGSATCLALAALWPLRGSYPRAAAYRGIAIAILTIVCGIWVSFAWSLDLISSGPYMYGPLYRSGADSLHDALRLRGNLVFAREGPNGLVTVRALPDGLISLQINGKTDASTGGDLRTQSLTAHLPLLLRAGGPGPIRKVLIIGLGSGVTLGAALAHPIQSAEVVEISAEVAEAARFFEEANGGALRDPRATISIGDARTRLLFHDDTFDVIASQPSNPWVAGQAFLFTREFFGMARHRLAPGGLMCQWVQGQGLDPADFRSVLATFSSAFPHVSLWQESTSGGDYLMVGSATPIRVDPVAIAARIQDETVGKDLARIAVDGTADLLSQLVTSGPDLERYTAGSPVQTDDLMAIEYTAPLSLHRETLGAILRDLEPHRTNPAVLAAGDPTLAAKLTRRARADRREREWAEGLGLFRVSAGWDPELAIVASHMRAGRRARAIDALRALTRSRPGDRLPHVMLAHLLMSSRDPEASSEAARALRRASDLDPADARLRLYLARALYASGRVEAALLENSRALQMDAPADSPVPRRLPPLLADAASDRCAMFLSTGDTASAEAACLEALDADKSLAEAHANLGLARARRGRTQEAESSYLQALALDPGLTDARFNLAALYERQGRGREGLEALSPALAAEAAADAAAHRLAARLALHAGDDGAARRHLEASLALDPGSEESAFLVKLIGAGRREESRGRR